MIMPNPLYDRQSPDDRRDGRGYSEGHRDVYGSVEAILRDPAFPEREAVQCHQLGVQPHQTGEFSQKTCNS